MVSSDVEADRRSEGDDLSKTKKPFPTLQLTIISLIQFTEPVSNTVIYPFINQFVAETGITHGDETKTGYYAGIVESAFFFAECLSVYHWGRLSDKIGRRPVLLLGPLGLALSIFAFGLSRNFWILVISRCFQGVFNGNIGVTKSVLVEITDPADVASAFAWIPAVWSIGITFGPVIGGGLARPAVRWPDTFGRFTFFHDYPYFLPCSAAAAIAFSSYLYTYFLLQESLPSAIHRDIERKRSYSPAPIGCVNVTAPLLDDTGDRNTDYGTSRPCESLSVDSSHANLADLEPPPFHALLTRELMIAIVCHGFIAFLDCSHGVLLPLMLSTSIPLGGLGFDPYTIGMTMGTWGLLNAGFQVVVFARMMRWLGPRKLCILSFSCFLLTFSAFPLMSILAKRAGEADYKVWLALTIQLCSYSFVFMTYGCTQLFVLNAAPGRAAIGAVNGLAQMKSSIMRTLAPTITSSLFSISLQKQIAGGYMVYAVLLGVTLAAVSMSCLLPPSLRGHGHK
ncbi:major facilitator superfamily domain-containing protein [Lyophyllum atratum]|nr:major facilitator superfamily domain-containing protein [Lyophyllum atratum]